MTVNEQEGGKAKLLAVVFSFWCVHRLNEDAKCWPGAHPHGTGSVNSEPNSGGYKQFVRNRACLVQSWFRRNALWVRTPLNKSPQRVLSCLPSIVSHLLARPFGNSIS